MLMLLSGLYNDKQTNSKLVITNFNFVNLFKKGELKDDCLHTLKHTEIFIRIKESFGDKAAVSALSFKELTTIGVSTDGYMDDTALAGNLIQQMTQNLEDVCFMDFRAEKELNPEEDQNFKLVVFGGILGDHPPKDRAKEFRSNFKQIRHLGKVQMTTDTAVLTSSEILELKRPFSTLKFIDNPEVPID